jgi:hypothetical protein
MRELQPVAFLISLSLVVAAFHTKNDNSDSIKLTYILMASLFFFLAYIGLFSFKKCDFRLFYYFGEISLLFGDYSHIFHFQE